VIAAVVVAFVLASSVPAAATSDSDVLNLIAPPIDRGIIINVPAFSLFYVEGGDVIASYPISVGRARTPTPEGFRVTETPLGRFSITMKSVNPSWIPPAWLRDVRGWSPDHVVGPGPDNPLGARWIGLDLPGYGIHGTNNVASLGRAVSLGCIRMTNEAVMELYDMVRPGDTVLIVHRRAILLLDEETQEPVLQLVPGLYSTSSLDLESLRHELLDLGYEITIRQLQSVGGQEASGRVMLALRQEDSLVVNGKTVGRVVVQDDGRDSETVLVPTALVIRSLNASVAQTAEYVNWTELVEQLEIGGEWRPEERVLYLWNTTVDLFGYAATRDAYRHAGETYVNVSRLASSRLGRYFAVDDGAVSVLGEPVAVEWRSGSPYTTVKLIAQRFRANTYWDPDANRVSVSYR